MHVAAFTNDVEVVKAAIEGGAAVDETNFLFHYCPFVRGDLASSGHTALHVAAMKNNVEAGKALIDGGAALDKQNGRGFSPLDYVVYRRQNEFEKMLINAGKEQGKILSPSGEISNYWPYHN